ncbi:MAG: aminotransferase class I/II-fold pyridoxal phosphate-dependent enzyme [Saprospiraceae bacterium]|jgi:methionine-gamma-lyase|nr:aminotransferase class I/II-fold pyridoxal phosphate-dependent enzyme [Saprospiraceae bacterium]
MPHINSLCAKEPHEPRTTQPHVLPLYATSSFAFENIDEGIAIFSNQKEGHGYSRYGNPTVDAVAAKIAALEASGTGLEAAGLLFSSGQAAVATMLMGILKSGDKILTQGNLYGGTTELFVKIFQPMGIETILTDLHDLEHVEDLIADDPAIKLLYFETPANPTLACVDIAALAGIAKRHGRYSAVDNTFATPYLQQPLRYGVDFIVHSTTKFLNGHGNSIAGALVTTHTAQMRMGGGIWQAMKLAGTNCSPWEAWLVHNGMKTLALRMDRHSENALAIAKFLQNDKNVVQVNYCGLPSHPDHEIAKRQMSAYGGMLSFELAGGLEAGIRFMNRIKFCTLAPTLGDVDTLILHPASMSHVAIPRQIREANGITDGLIRLSVGIEHVDDIVEDLTQAMK